MKNILVIVMMFGNVYSQIPFCYLDYNPDRWEVVGDLERLSHGFVAATLYNDAGQGGKDSEYHSVIRTFDLDCKPLDSLVIGKEGRAVNILSLKWMNGFIYGLGNHQNLSDEKDLMVYIIKLDESLQILGELEIEVPYGTDPWSVKAKIQDSSHLMILYSLFPYPAPGTLGKQYNFVIRLPENLVNHQQNLIECTSRIGETFELEVLADQSGYYLFGWITLVLNLSLEIIDTLNIVELDFFDFGCRANSLSVRADINGTYLLAGMECVPYDIGINRLDRNLKLLKLVKHGTPKLDLAPFNRSLDWIDRNYLYSCGFGLSTGPVTDFFVFCVDSNLNTRWIKYYGGDFNYRTNSLLALPDGSVIIGGDKLNLPSDRDPFILKIDSTGNITSTYSPLGGEKFWSVKVYPNPVSDYLKMEFENVKGELIITLVNADGKIVMKDNYNHLDGTINLNLLDLPFGIYLYDVIHQNRRIAQGKVVKK